MEVTCQSLAAMFAVWKESNRNASLPDSAVDGVIESIVRWEKLEALLGSALKHLPKMVTYSPTIIFEKREREILCEFDAARYCCGHRLREYLPHRYPHVAPCAHRNVRSPEEES